jgi:hypothetical protein
VAFALLTNAEPAWIARLGSGTALLIAVSVATVWAALVSVVAARSLTGEARSVVELAERGVGSGNDERMATGDDWLSSVQRRLASTLEDRNRQIADLAALVRSAPIAQDAPAVAHAMVAGARQVTGDPTWLLAVLRVETGRNLIPGVYGPDVGSDPEPLSEVHRWASTAEVGSGSRGARLAAGPWGAFSIVDVAAGEELRAILLAPWEGRPEPSPAEFNLFGLLGQHAATAIEHAMLYTRLASRPMSSTAWPRCRPTSCAASPTISRPR